MLSTYINELIYIVIGLIIMYNAYGSYKNVDNPKRYTTSLFWFILGFIFIVPNLNVFYGSEERLIPDYITGILVVVLAFLSLFKGITLNNYKADESKKGISIGAKIFIPAAGIGILSFVFYFISNQLVVNEIMPAEYDLGSIGSLGLAIVVSTIIAIIITKDKPKNAFYEGRRLLDIIGPLSILPQILAALGAIFTLAGVGEYISTQLGNVVPEGNILIGVIVYCVGMALFTIIMGNGFAAFSVITAGIGVPFVIAQGGNPAIVGALGLTAGYCGTLLTPMAANFNIVPANVMEIKNNWAIIRSQAPIAVVLLAIHIVLMYTLAF